MQIVCLLAPELPGTHHLPYLSIKHPSMGRKTSDHADQLLPLTETRKPLLTAKLLKDMNSGLLGEVRIQTTHHLFLHLNLSSHVIASRPYGIDSLDLLLILIQRPDNMLQYKESTFEDMISLTL